MPESRRLAWTEVTFGDVATKRANLRHLLEQVRPDRVVIEICPLAGWVYDLACEMAIAIQVADPTQDAWKWKSVKRKTDEDDALKLARLSALGQLNLVHMPSPKMRQWRRLVEQRHTLVAERTRCKNRIRAVLLQEERHLPPVQWGWSLTKREELRGLARPLVECESRELWRGLLHTELRHLEQIEGLVAEVEAKLDGLAAADRRTVLVSTIPGVAQRTAEVIVTALDEVRRFKTARQVASYAGLTPRRFQSGQMDRQGRISKRGNRLLRQVLNQAAWMAVRWSRHFRAVFLRISGQRPARRKLAIVAVMRKLLVTAWAMLRDGRAYRPPRSAPVSAAA
ncbi:MAG: IS110 family RNA-guided transposase [Planctomycetota bacterium]